MQLKLKESPKEWLKFTAVMALLASVLSYTLYRPVFRGVVVAAALALIVCAIRPCWFRGFYRGGMTVSFYIGLVMGRIMLTVLFILVLAPLGILLRLSGKDLLRVKRAPAMMSYWRTARTSNQFDRMF